MRSHSNFMHPRKTHVTMKVQQGKARDTWTLDAWDRALDWDQAHPDEAAAFLESQGLTGDFENLTAKALRGVGFTKMYETGRIEPVAVGAGKGGISDIKTILNSIHGLTTKTNMLTERITNLERRSTQIFIKHPNGETMPLDVKPCDTIYQLKCMIRDREGMQP
jgi:hypothetical protein